MREDAPEHASLSATAAVALRWRIGGRAGAAQLHAECAASVRALAACLEAEGAAPDGLPPDRVEAKIDLLLVTLDRLSAAIDPAASDGGRSEFLYCDARFTAGSVEWDEPVPPPDGTVVVVEVRVATGHPVTACLPATLARHPDAPVAAPGAAAVRVLATLAPMPAATRDAYERCVFILHRRAIRRAHGDFGAA
ncbi:MAG: hypothetical protein ING77_07945 [Rhodocyclaceae bacterium]|nr:hypothetical protein [Rhodocyclaceae bacterium]